MNAPRCRYCAESHGFQLVRRFFANNWHAVVQCDGCLGQIGGSISRDKVGGPLMDLPEWDGSADEPRASASSPTGAPLPGDAEADLRRRTMDRLRPWFVVREEVPVRLVSGGTGRIDVLAIPRDERFSRFAFAIEEKRRLHATADIAKRIKQAADYVRGEVADDPHVPPICMAFVNLMNLPLEREQDRFWLMGSMMVAHQFRVGLVAEWEKDGSLYLRCGPHDVWRERGFAETKNQWPGRAIERLTNTRQRAGGRE
jgi:hypothetical protein